MKRILFIFIIVIMVCVLSPLVHAKEDFPINIAVEFTDHAASAYIAKEKGWFANEGIKPTFYNYITGMALASALGRGDIQAAYVCLVPAITAYANAKIPIKIVTGLHKRGYGLAVNPSKVKSVKDLEKPDVRIGAVQKGGPVDVILMKTIEKYSLDRDKVLTKVQRMNPPQQIMAIRAGKLDASFVPEHWPVMAENEGFKILLTSQDVWPDMPGSVLVVKEELIKNNPDIVKKLVEITNKATSWIKQNPDDASFLVAKSLLVTGEKIFPVEAAKTATNLSFSASDIKRSMGRLEYTKNLDSKAVQETIDFAVRQQYISKGFNAQDILDLRFSK